MLNLIILSAVVAGKITITKAIIGGFILGIAFVLIVFFLFCAIAYTKGKRTLIIGWK
jgi:hypothetical protein